MEVQELLHIDRSTVYRIAEGERLPSIRVGRTWRFPADKIAALLTAGPDAPLATTAANPVAQTTIEVAVELLGVMIVVTDMNGQPVTDVVNPCPWPSKSCAPDCRATITKRKPKRPRHGEYKLLAVSPPSRSASVPKEADREDGLHRWLAQASQLRLNRRLKWV